MHGLQFQTVGYYLGEVKPVTQAAHCITSAAKILACLLSVSFLCSYVVHEMVLSTMSWIFLYDLTIWYPHKDLATGQSDPGNSSIKTPVSVKSWLCQVDIQN